VPAKGIASVIIERSGYCNMVLPILYLPLSPVGFADHIYIVCNCIYVASPHVASSLKTISDIPPHLQGLALHISLLGCVPLELAMAVTQRGQPLRMTQWKYVNAALTGTVRNSVIWECNGLIVFQGSFASTDWHGLFQRRDDGFLELQFNAGGSEYPLRSTLLLPSSPVLARGIASDEVLSETWVGTDYAGRGITLTFLQTWEKIEGSDAWRPLPRFGTVMGQAVQ
jgi:hypothetical protein